MHTNNMMCHFTGFDYYSLHFSYRRIIECLLKCQYLPDQYEYRLQALVSRNVQNQEDFAYSKDDIVI